MKTQLETFRTNLESFAQRHRSDIQRDPAFRAKFQEMCYQIGVDPIACASRPPSPPGSVRASRRSRLTRRPCSRRVRGRGALAATKGFWSEMLGMGSFYYELAIQAITVCYKARSRTGGIMDLPELVRLLRDHRGKRAEPISECVPRARAASATSRYASEAHRQSHTHPRVLGPASGTTSHGPSSRWPGLERALTLSRSAAGAWSNLCRWS